MQSIQSNALEPTRHELKQLSFSAKLARLLPTYGLVILTSVSLFSRSQLRKPFDVLNVRSIIRQGHHWLLSLGP